MTGIDLYDRDIGIRVSPQNLGAQFASIAQGHINFERALDNVIICQDVTVDVIHDNTGTKAFGFALRLDPGQVEKTLEYRIVEQRAAHPGLAAGRDIHHCRGCAFEHGRQTGQWLIIYRNGQCSK